MTNPMYSRHALVGDALATIFTITGCETEDQPDARRGAAVPDLTPECDVNGEAS